MIWYVIVAFRMFLECVCICLCLTHPWLITFILYSNMCPVNYIAVAIRTGTVRRVWFAIRTAVGIFLAIVGEIFVFFDF